MLPIAGVGEFHYGDDIAASCGSPIRAATSGTVESVGPNGTLGNWVLIDNGDGIETGYGHIADAQTLVSVGDAVAAGQVIAGVGSTGASTGCHLHFEVHIDGVRVNPMPFLAQRGIVPRSGLIHRLRRGRPAHARTGMPPSKRASPADSAATARRMRSA